MSKPLFGGISAALVTPFTADGEVDVAAVPALVDFLLDRGAHAISNLKSDQR